MTEQPLPAASPNPDWAGRILAVAGFGWILGVVAFAQAFIFFAPEVFALFGVETQPLRFLALLAQSLFIGLPLLFLALLWNTPRYRAIFKLWTWAAAFGVLLAPAHLPFIPTQSQAATFTQLLLTLLFGLILRYFLKRRPSPHPQTTPLYLALICAALLALPWLYIGALGSLLDFLLNLALGLALGWTAAQLINRIWLPVLEADGRSANRNILVGGFVIGPALLLLSSSLGFNGMQILLILVAPSLAWLIMALAYLGSDAPRPLPRAFLLLIGLATAVPLIFTDTDMLSLLALLSGGRETIHWAAEATSAAMLLGWVLGLTVWSLRWTLADWLTPRLGLGLAAALWLLGGALYLAAGQPGLYGDRLFVILNDQADITAAAGIADYDQRRQSVYETLVSHADTAQADLRADLDRFGVDYTPYYLVNALEVEGGTLLRWWLSLRSDVDRILPSPVLRPLPAPPVPPTGDHLPPPEPAWNLVNIDAPRVWQELGVTGAGVTIGQSDSGVQWNHPELIDGYRGVDDHDYNWYDPWYGSEVPVDVNGHGTHTLGSALGNSVGVAPDADWFACTNLSRNLANPALYLDCLQFMLAPFPLGGDPLRDGDPLRSAHVLNNSWGCPQAEEGCDPDSLRPAVEALRAAGIFVVASAGNEGPACSSVQDAIATYDASLSVGAVNQAGEVAEFSSRGPVTADGSGRIKPDILAPGVAVLSAYPNNSYETADGTSMAGPHVAGVVALMWSANPALIGDIEGTEQLLFDTAVPYTGPTLPTGAELPGLDQSCLNVTAVPNNLAGYGIIDAYGAVQAALDLP